MANSIQFNLPVPDADELEITVLGPGTSSGESIVVHIKDGEWIVIDSCTCGNRVLPLYYLKDLLHVPLTNVSMVICSHWHLDHVQGLPAVLNECPNAELYIAQAGDFKGVLNHILDMAGLDTIDSRVWTIFDECLTELSNNQRPKPHYLGHNEPVFTPKQGPVEMNALGPSDEMFRLFTTSLANITPENPKVSEIENLEGNMCSLALSMKYVGQRILLGGDMEVGRNDRYDHTKCSTTCGAHAATGWCDVIENSKVLPLHRPYTFVKLPHHSSVTGYCPEIWKKHMNNPVGVTTAFDCGNSEDLPHKDMLELYKNHCKSLYITYGNDAVKEIEEEHEMKPAIEGIEVLEEVKETIGIVVSRWKSGEEDWKVYTFGEGHLVDEEYLKNYHIS